MLTLGSTGGAKHWRRVKTGYLEVEISTRKTGCEGAIQSYCGELELHRQVTGSILTLRHESAGIEQG